MNHTTTPAESELTGNLHTSTPADGHALARRLAAMMLKDHEPQPTTMAGMLRRPVESPSAVLVTAIYFHAIAIANRGWHA